MIKDTKWLSEDDFFFCSITQYRQVKELNKVKASQSLLLALQKKYRCYWMLPTLSNCLSPSPTSMLIRNSDSAKTFLQSLEAFCYFPFSRLVAFETSVSICKQKGTSSDWRRYVSFLQAEHAWSPQWVLFYAFP